MRTLPIAVMLLALATLAGAFGTGSAETAAARHQTDEAVRTGMIAIRDLVRLNHSLITHRRMPPDHAARFAAAIRAQADRILATTTISGEARESLRGLLDEVAAGVAAVAGRDPDVSPLDGLVRVDEALARYPELFDHPGWAPPQSLD